MLIDFSEDATDGTGLNFILKRFSDHHDFIQAKADGCFAGDSAVEELDKRKHLQMYDELVQLLTLDGWLREDKYLENAILWDLEDAVEDNLIAIEELTEAEGMLDRNKVREFRGVGQQLTD